MKSAGTRLVLATIVAGCMGLHMTAGAVGNSAFSAVPPEGLAPAVTNILLPLDLGNATNVVLAGPGVDLGEKLALAANQVPRGLVQVDQIPFQVSDGALDIQTSLAGAREQVRVKYGFMSLNVTKTPNPGRLAVRIPSDQYAAVHVIAFSRKIKDAVPRMTISIGQSGGGMGILENTKVNVPDILQKGEGSCVVSRIPVKLANGKEGCLYHLRVPVPAAGNVWEAKKNFSLEFTRDVNPHVNLPDPNEYGPFPSGPPSGVIVLAATLERSPLNLSYTTDESGNVFYENQKPVFHVNVQNVTDKPVKGKLIARCAGPGTGDEAGLDRQEWRVSADVEVKPGETASANLDVTPASGKRGWYSCNIAAEVNGQAVHSRDTTFARLAPDTRKAFDESPFGVWEFWSPHTIYRNPEANRHYQDLATLMKKGGWRWTYGGMPTKSGSREGRDFTDEDRKEFRETYGLRMTTQSLPESYQRDEGWYDAEKFETEVIPALKRMRSTVNIDNAFKVLHESRSSNDLLRRLSEFLGGTPYNMPEAEKKKVDTQFENVKKYCAGIKKADPTAKIVLINDYPSVAIEYMKRGFPKESFDIFGLECANFLREPERQPDWLSLLGHGETMRKAMKQYGYEDKELWTTEALYHGTAPGYLSLHRQGIIYIREAMIALGTGFTKLAAAGILKDSTDDYYFSNWGSTGFCYREPEINPKPSYAMMAWLTQVLDMTKFAGFLKSDSTSLHVLDFATKDGNHVYPVWVPRGRQKVTLAFEGKKPVVYDVYGNDMKIEPKEGAVEVLASDTPVYVTGVTVTAVTGRAPVEVQKDPGTILVQFDNPRMLAVAKNTSKILESNWDYPRVKGTFNTEFTKEGEDTILRVALQPDEDNRKLLQRYAELVLDKPIELPGQPYQITARVKGNGGWGKLMIEMVDAKGRIWTSCGNQYAGSCNASDNDGDSFISFDGWQTMEFQCAGQYPASDQFVAWTRMCNWWPENTPEWKEAQAKYDADMKSIEARTAEYEKQKQEYEAAKKAYEALPAKEKKTAAKPSKKEPAKPRPPQLRNYGISPVDYPVKLTKVIVAMPPSVLYVNGEIPVAKPEICIDWLGVRQPPEVY